VTEIMSDQIKWMKNIQGVVSRRPQNTPN